MQKLSNQEGKAGKGAKGKGLSGAKDSGEVRRRAAMNHQQELTGVKERESDDDYDDYDLHEDIPATFEDEQDRWTKETVLKAAKDAALVKAYEQGRKQIGVMANPVDDEDPDVPSDERKLNRNWRALRYFIGDRDVLGNEKEKGIGFQSVRLRLNDSFQSFDPRNTGLLDQNKVLQAFNRVQCSVKTDLSNKDLEELFAALRVYHNRERKIIRYREILAAPTHKEERLMNGIFPAIKAKEERKSKTGAAHQDERTRQQEQLAAHRRNLEEQEKKKLQAAIKAAKQQSNFGAARSSPKKKTAKEIERDRRAQEKIEEAQRQIAKREQDERDNKLEADLRQEMSRFNQSFNLIKQRVLKEGGIENKFRLADKNGDGELSLKEFYAIRDQYKLSLGPADINFLYDNLDKDKSGKISYREMMDAFKGHFSVLPMVRERIRERLVASGKYSGVTPSDIKKQQKASRVADHAANTYNDIRTESGMGLSDLMRRSDVDSREPRKLIDENEHKNNFEYIKRHINEKCESFDDMLKAMGAALPGSEGKVTVKDFQKAVVYYLGDDLFSGPQVKFVFRWMVQQAQQECAQDLMMQDESQAFIPVTAFKDKLLLPHSYARDTKTQKAKKIKPNKPKRTAMLGDSEDSEADAQSDSSSDASVGINAILENRQKPEEGKDGPGLLADVKKSKLQQLREETHQQSRDESPEKDFSKVLATNSDDDIESIMSNPIDNVLNADGAGDPRALKTTVAPLQDQNNGKKQMIEPGTVYRVDAPSTHGKKLRWLEQTEYDRTLDTFVLEYIGAITEDLKIMGSKKSRLPETLVDRYGLVTPGFINFKEFKAIYKAHVHEQLEDYFSVKMADDNKLLALFNLIDGDNKHRISRDEYAKFIQTSQIGADLIERMKKKCMKGGMRMWTALKAELMQADLYVGDKGSLSMPVFQTVMRDFDLPMIMSDRDALHAKQLLRLDEDGDTLVVIRDLLDIVKPAGKAAGADELTTAAVFIQRMWRRYLASKPSLSKQMGGKLEDIKEQNTAIDKGLEFNPVARNLKKQQPSNTSAKSEAQKLRALEKKRAADDKASGIRGTGKNGEITDVDRKARADAENFIKSLLNIDILPKALSYGESLGTCREIQKHFEERAVTKNLFPLMLDIQMNVQGVQPKSLQTLDSLGQVMFMDSQNTLSQYDIATEKVVSNSMNLGTRPPLKHYPIIDMVCDQRSGRIYTLNGNWILEIWNINQEQDNSADQDSKEQKTTSRGSKCFPEKRIAVCTNEGGKDFISHHYKQSYNNSKPKFLSLQESNQQILLVNTSCVDSSIVFIDPISFSVLKKVTLRYQDYEIPATLRKSIMTLRGIFDSLKTNKGKDMSTIFLDLLDRDSEEIEIRHFVNHLMDLEVDIERDHLYKIMRTLDADGSGSISLDEFLNFFGMIKNEEEEAQKAREEHMLHDELWPQWLIRDDKLSTAQNLLANMAHHLATVHGFTAEAAFALYDTRDDGAISHEQFMLIMNIFFSEILTESEIEFLTRLCVYRNDQKIFYREFCKFLDARLVRTFKNVTIRSTAGEAEYEAGTVGNPLAARQKTPLELELEKPLKKEASISYVLRKAAEIGKDLRREFQIHDPLELNVISRSQFWGIISDMPLGLAEREIEDIFDHDLQFDNYGNVDYTHVLAKDMFVALERNRLKDRANKKSAELAEKRMHDNIMERAKAGEDSIILDLDEDEPKKTISLEDEEVEEAVKPIDTRKVVVEDLIYIDDLQIIIYSTVSPRTSTLFVTSLKKDDQSKPQNDDDGTKIVNLADLNNYNLAELQMLKRKKAHKDKESQLTMLNQYPLLAKLVGHKNQDPPSLCYISESGCLVTGEKHMTAFPLPKEESKSGDESEGDTPRSAAAPPKAAKCEIIVWNLQRDMVELFSMKPPWNIPFYHKFNAHDASILDISYMSKAQLIVTSSADKTIRWWDPATSSYELTDPGNNPHAQMKPGYHKALMKESTRDNVAFREVRRVYTGGDTICPALRVLRISNIVMNPENPHIKSTVEWVVCLSLQRPLTVQTAEAKAAQTGYLLGYGIERVKIQVPARHHDDIVPPAINKECLEMVKGRRKKTVQIFQKQLPETFEKTRDQQQQQVQLFEEIRSLFMQAILNRKDAKYVNPEPLRKIYQIILRLPARNQFQGFLASSGCSDKLSVSETFLYLQKFMQIHPLRTTQIEFERSIGDFYYRHQRSYLPGIKRWAKPSLQKFANYIKIHGLNIEFFRGSSEESQDPMANKLMNTFCTRERIQEYFVAVVKGTNKEQEEFNDEEVDIVLQELDPYNTGVIQINSIQRLFVEEINYYNQVSANLPNSILEKLRKAAFPLKRQQLQKALCEVDKEGDGYISKKQFVEAIYDAGVHLVRDEVEFLFDVMSEAYNKNDDSAKALQQSTDKENEHDQFKELNKELTKKDKQALVLQQGEKYIFLPFLFNKLFHQNELSDLNEIDATLNLVKAALIYKGADFGIIFAEKSQENESKKRSRGRNQNKSKDSAKVEMGNYYTRFAEQIVNQEFVNRVMQLNAQNVYEPQVKRLANFLALNQKNQSVIYLNTWMHHLRRTSTAFHIADKDMLPVICSKLLRNETVFRGNLDTIGMIKNHREQEKFIELADLKSVLHKYNLTYINQCLFLQEFTHKGSVHVEDLITRMKTCVRDYYSPEKQALNVDQKFGTPEDLLPKEARTRTSGEPTDLRDIKNQDFFNQTQKKIRNNGHSVDLQLLTRRFANFDASQTGQIAAHKLVGVLKHNYSFIFDEETLRGLQFELESLYNDHQVDYRDFVETFFRDSDGPNDKNSRKTGVTRINLGENKSGRTAYNAQEYEDLMGAFSAHISKDNIDIENIVQIFSKESGFITKKNLGDIFKLCSYSITEDQLDLIVLYCDEGNQGSLLAYDIIDRIKFATQVAPEFNVQKWIESTFLLSGKRDLLLTCQQYMSDLETHMAEFHAYNLPLKKSERSKESHRSGATSQVSEKKPKTSSAVLTGKDFQTMLLEEIPHLSQSDIELLTKFCIRGSRRIPDQTNRDILNSKRKEALTNAFTNKKKPYARIPALDDALFFDCDLDMDVIQFSHFQLSIPECLRTMGFDRPQNIGAQSNGKDKKIWFFKVPMFDNKMTNEQKRRESQLVDKIQGIFRQREYTFYDAFKEVYDPIAKRNLISMKVFKEKVRKLNLPMTVQDHRILRRIAQDKAHPHQVDLKVFCPRFESVILRKMRLTKILDKLATSFYLQNLNLKRAFQIFDLSGDGIISRREFRQGFTQLDLGLSYDEIDDLMSMISSDGQTISYDDFIHSMDDNIRKRKASSDSGVEDAIMKKLKEVLDYSGESFFDAMRVYDFDGSETINVADLSRVFKRLGISTIEPYIPYLHGVGGVRPKDQKIDIITFQQAIMKEMNIRNSRSKKLKQEVLNKLHSLMKSKELSVFDLFVRLDANHSGNLDKIELRSGIAQMGMNLSSKEFDILWKAVYGRRGAKPSTRVSVTGGKVKDEQQIGYQDLLKTFYKAGCIKLQHQVDRSTTLMTKFRQQLKKRGLQVEKAYKAYDPEDNRFVFRNDFKGVSWNTLDLDFEEDELDKIFDLLCAEGTKPTDSADQQAQAVDKPLPNNQTRFVQKQFMDAIQINRGDNWLNQAFIKIHQIVHAKNLSYKRLFKNWQDKKSKSGLFRLNSAELHAGLKKLRAGLTADEINKMTQSLPFNPKEHDTISADEFKDQVVQGADKLKNEESFQKALVVQWVTQFNTQMETNLQPLETLFSSFDEESKGGLTFDNFTALNEYVGVPMYKTELRRVFDLIDARKVGRVSMDEVRAQINLCNNNLVGTDDSSQDKIGVGSKEEGLMRQQVSDIYEKIKDEILNRNVTFEQILFTDCKLNPLNLATPAGFILACEKLTIKVTLDEAKQIIQDLRNDNNGKVECTYKNLIEFLTKARINVQFLEKGFIDPMLANSVSQLALISSYYNLSPTKLFRVLDADGGGQVSKQEFMSGMQGMELNLTLEEILELFNFMDDKQVNSVNRQQFVDSASFLMNKLGGPTLLESSATAKSILENRKGVPNKQLVFKILDQICDTLQKEQFSIRQLMVIMDRNKTGYLSRQEFVNAINSIAQAIPLDQVRKLSNFFDNTHTGSVAVADFVGICQDLLNQKIGSGVFLHMQAQPIIKTIINSLAIDCDKFFDEVADLNQLDITQKQKKWEAEMTRKRTVVANATETPADAKSAAEYKMQMKYQKEEVAPDPVTGLSKSILFAQLQRYGVGLSEQEKDILSSVYAMDGCRGKDMLDYEKLDQAFEAIQQQLYSSESLYTKEWERRVFKRIGSYLQKHNRTMKECFDLIDTDSSGMVSVEDLKIAFIRFDLGISDAGFKVLVSRMDPQKKGYLTQEEFLTRFWSAYTYDEDFDAEKQKELEELKRLQMTSFLAVDGSKSQADSGIIKMPSAGTTPAGVAAARQKVVSEYDNKLRMYKVFRAIQHQIRSNASVQEAFTKLDSHSVGYLTLMNFQANFSKHFDLSLKKDEVRLLFQEIDSDENGIVQYAEFEQFYSEDYIKKAAALEKDREVHNTQNEIFDHLLKMIKQRGLTLQEVFDQIDNDKNMFIELEEFHELLEVMGFTITKEQTLELMQRMDDNFDGRISYSELKAHIERLGFDVDELERGARGRGINETSGTGSKVEADKEFQWRDKALEIIVRALNKKLKQSRQNIVEDENTNQNQQNRQLTITQYFELYDADMDLYLTPAQFRKAMHDLNEPQLKNNQIERVIHVLLDSHKQNPLINIERINKLISNYKNMETGENGSVRIDEDLFVYIVEMYDGFSRLMNLIQAVEDKSSYISRHTSDISLRGLTCMSNQRTLQKLTKKNTLQAELHQSALVLLSNEVSAMIKDESKQCVLDPYFNVATQVSDQNTSILSQQQVPTISNTDFDIHWTTSQLLACGALKYNGHLIGSNDPIDIHVFPSEVLQHPSQDGKLYKKHLDLELQMHRYMMHSQSQDTFELLGTYEKKIGLGAHDKDVYVINRSIDTDKWVCFDDFVHENGGLLNVPMFYNTDAPLYVIRYWAKLVLQIIHRVHDVSIVLRCLNTKQLWFSRDGMQVRLSGLRNIARSAAGGQVKDAPDIQINLEDNNVFNIARAGTTNVSPSKQGGGSTSRRTDQNERQFSNKCLDNPFLAPEVLFKKSSEHDAKMDVWSFGMILFCLLTGKKPKSFYSVYRDWYRRSSRSAQNPSGYDVEASQIPFTPPSRTNFVYDPFSYDFDNPFDSGCNQNIGQEVMKQLKGLSDAADSDTIGDFKSEFDFKSFMKCISKLSYSAMFDKAHCTKFQFLNMDELTKQAQKARGKKKPLSKKELSMKEEERLHQFKCHASAEVLSRKNELGLILDTISSCLEMNPDKRPTIRGLINSPLFDIDSSEKAQQARFCQNAILYRSPTNSVSMRITAPLRQICADAIINPMSVYDSEVAIQQLFSYTADCVRHYQNGQLQKINEVIAERQKKQGLEDNIPNYLRGKETQDYSITPNGPLATQVINDHVVDMLMFVCFRYMENFEAYRTKRIAEVAKIADDISQSKTNLDGASRSSSPAKVGFAAEAQSSANDAQTQSQFATTEVQTAATTIDKKEVLRMLAKQKKNHVLASMCRLLKTMMQEMHSYSTPMAPYAHEVLKYIVKFFIGEEHEFGSDIILQKTSTEGIEPSLKQFLGARSFFRCQDDLDQQFKPDKADKRWFQNQKDKKFLDRSNHWSLQLHDEAIKLYKESISESGMGQSCYQVLNDYIQSVTENGGTSRNFSKQMTQIAQLPMERTRDYYNELVPLQESIAKLNRTKKKETGQEKRAALMMIRQTFQSGNPDKIKACLDVRAPKHIIHYLQDAQMEVRQETLLILREISKGLQDEDFEILTKHSVTIKQENKDNQAEEIDATARSTGTSLKTARSSTGIGAKRGRQSKQETKQPQSDIDQMASYIKRVQLTEKEQNEKFVSFGLDLPNLNFTACKPFLKELATCFESPVFVAPMIRLLKTPNPHESYANKQIILEIIQNLACGNEKVLKALNSSACETYMALLQLLRIDPEASYARLTGRGLNSQIRNFLLLQDKAIDLFKFMFEQRKPTIIRDLLCIGASATLLREQKLEIPEFIMLPDLMGDYDLWNDDWQNARDIEIDELSTRIKDLRCFLKHFYDKSTIPQSTKATAMKRCIKFLIKVFKYSWNDYFGIGPGLQKGGLKAVSDQMMQAREGPSEERKQNYLELMRQILMFFEWTLQQKRDTFLFSTENGKENLDFIITYCNKVLQQFKTPTASKVEDAADFESYKKRNSAEKQFPLTEHGAILQNIQFQLVRMNKSHINELLAFANFGQELGNQLLLDYEFVGHCVDNCTENPSLLNSYVKKNEIRLNTIEYLLKNHEHTLKDQLLKSSFLEKVLMDYIHDFREFGIQQSKINVQFLAFRKGFPLRQEAISIFNTILLCKDEAPQVYAELIMQARRHFLVQQEADLIRPGRITSKEATSLLLLAIVLEANEEDLEFVMTQAGVPQTMSALMKQQPSLGTRFPVLAAYAKSHMA